MDTTFKKSAITRKLGQVRPIEIFSHERREIDEKTVTDLIEALARDGHFLYPIVVRDEGESQCRLVAGGNRLEAWKRRFGEERPIPAIIYPQDTPDLEIEILEIEENLYRHELSAAEREAQTIPLAVALNKLNGEVPVTPISDSDEAAETGNQVPRLAPATGGRGKKGVAQQIAERLGISKRAVRKRLRGASAAIGEKIDLDRDTPEELERKADKRQRAEPKLVRLKRRKPAPRVEDPTPPAEPCGEIDSQIDALWKAFDAIGKTHKLRFIHDACLRLGFDPLLMAPPAAFGLADEKPKVAVDSPAEVSPASDAAPQDSLTTDDAAADSVGR